MRRSIIGAGIFLAALTIVLGLVGPALAHAFLTRASPPVGSTLKAAPAEIALRFSEPIEATFSSVVVTGSGGERVDAGETHVAPGEPTILRTALKPLAPVT